MIVTVTPNPSIDRTVTLGGPLTRGAVHRVRAVSNEPGGKGVNVARALTMAGVNTIAVLPACPGDPFLTMLAATGIVAAPIAGSGLVRTNLAITETDGTTTKINEPGARLDGSALAALTDGVVQRAADADWLVLSGSLPPGVSADWYAEIVLRVGALNCKVAVDTSDAPLTALAASFDRGAPDLVKPNSDELAGLTGHSADDLENAVAQGNPGLVVAAARDLVKQGVGTVLATLGASGAILVDTTGAWLATPPPIVPKSTVGAGDSSLAGYLRADVDGAPPPRRLQLAVAYGSAAAALPGSALPSPGQVDAAAVAVVRLE